ncbi:MAG: endonuclease/exonuclease/phosphatase family protein [Myxococcota bacterium]
MRLATFNVENLFTRYLFARGIDPRSAGRHGFTADDLRFRLSEPESKRLTAETMLATRADVFALQEVESLPVLKQFRDQHLGGASNWPYALVIDGNDSRGIDVGVLSRYPIVHARSWQYLEIGDRYAFDRDCLEVDLETPLGVLTLYVNHFKSMRAPNRTDGHGRALTRARREEQARSVREIVCSRFGDDPSDGAFVVLGDFNDYVTDDHQGRSGIRSLVQWSAVENVVDRLPEAERWTHYFPGYANEGLAPAYRQLDFLLPSRRLARLNPGVPEIERRGQPGRATRYAGPRLPGVGHRRPKASDHCPLVFEIEAL